MAFSWFEIKHETEKLRVSIRRISGPRDSIAGTAYFDDALLHDATGKLQPGVETEPMPANWAQWPSDISKYPNLCQFYIKFPAYYFIQWDHKPDADMTIGPAGTLIIWASVKNGIAPYTYTWYHDGEKLDNVTGSELRITGLEDSDAGVYKVVVTDSLGHSLESETTLTVA